ncbi:MAG: hypothetical protein IPL26_20705 [Leptospiraceae bacterium]|nr:hypothetical protein [Leptospiraceae bacterium]
MENEIDLNRCKTKLSDSIKKLGGNQDLIKQEDIDSIANLIIQSMTGTWRYFHTPEHIFEVGGEEDPVEILAGLFHDMIYIQVDSGININLSGYIYPFVREANGKLYIINNSELGKIEYFHMLLLIFGFKIGDFLNPYGGQNEFLSALVAVQCLNPYLSMNILVQIAACIEATIAFRRTIDGISPYDILKNRIIEVNKFYSLSLHENEINEILKKSLRMANRDVENFGNPNSVKFLDNTWNLMPETNHDLRTSTSYTIVGYRTSMLKMLNFLKSLKPEYVFHQYMDEPNSERLEKLFKDTRKNLELSRIYLESKILTVGILEALSFRIGRNIPLSTLIGEIPINGIVIPTLDYFLPEVENPYIPQTVIEEEALYVLTNGRNKDTSYDLKNSPIASYLVKAIGFPEIERLFEISIGFYENKLSAEEFLQNCDPNVVESIIKGIIEIFKIRTKNLRKLKNELTE